MSPSERDLRASLQQGEGDPIDVDRIVAAGAAAQSQRRARLVGVAAAVVLVTAGASVTGVVLARHDGGTQDSAASSDDARAAAGGGAAQSRRSAQQPALVPAPSSASSSAASSPTASSPSVQAAACPDAYPQRMLPGGGSPGQFGSDTPLFASTPVSITACRYAGTGAITGSTVLTGRDATALGVSLEQASRTARPCPITRAAVPTRRFAFLAVDAQGRMLRVVTTTVQASYCAARTTNGTAVRFGWTPPASLTQRLGLSDAPVAPSPTGKIVGSPVR